MNIWKSGDTQNHNDKYTLIQNKRYLPHEFAGNTRKQANGCVKNKDKSDFLEIYRSYQEVNFEACKHAVNPY